MNKLRGMLLAVLLFAAWGSAWADCINVENNSLNISNYTMSECIYGDLPDGLCPSIIASSCPEVGKSPNSDFYFTNLNTSLSCNNTTEGCPYRLYKIYINACTYNVRCDNKCEADSLVCVQGGNTWTNTGASTCDGKSCKMSNCLQSDTLWLNDSKAACDAIGGENNYAIADIDETCVHSGICCPPDSALVGNTCKWRCDSIYTACTAKNGYLYAGVLQDTTISGSDSTFTNKCYYNCSYAYNKDSTTSVTEGNTACSSPSTLIADCTRMPNDFSSVRTTYGDSVYSYDFLTPGSAAYIDSIVLTPCSRFMYRCTVNGKYRYWYSDADIPTGCTNIVKIK